MICLDCLTNCAVFNVCANRGSQNEVNLIHFIALMIFFASSNNKTTLAKKKKKIFEETDATEDVPSADLVLSRFYDEYCVCYCYSKAL